MVTNFIIRVTASIFFIEGSIQVKWDKSLSPKLKIQRPNCNWVPMNHNTLDFHYKSRTELNWIWLSWTEFFKYSRRARQFELIDPNRNSNFITSTDYSTQTFNSMSRDKALHNTFNQDLGQIQDSQHFYDSNHEWFFLGKCHNSSWHYFLWQNWESEGGRGGQSKILWQNTGNQLFSYFLTTPASWQCCFQPISDERRGVNKKELFQNTEL